MYKDLILILLILGIYSSWLTWFNFMYGDFWYVTYRYKKTKLEERYIILESRFINYMYLWSKKATYNYFLFGLTLVVGLFVIIVFEFLTAVYAEWLFWHSSGQWDVFIYAIGVNPLGGLFVIFVFLVLLLVILLLIFIALRLLCIIYLPEYFKR